MPKVIQGIRRFFIAYQTVNSSFTETATCDCNTASPIVDCNTAIANTIEKSAAACRKYLLVFESD